MCAEEESGGVAKEIPEPVPLSAGAGPLLDASFVKSLRCKGLLWYHSRFIFSAITIFTS